MQSQVGLRKHHWNKASGDDGITAGLFQILKDDVVKVLHSIWQQIWKTQQWPQDWKMSIFIPIPKKGNAKEFSNYCTVALISHASEVMLKILQARLQQYLNHELPDVKLDLERQRNQTSNWQHQQKNRENPEKHHWLSRSLCLCGSQQTVENSSRVGNTRSPYLPPEKSVCRSRSNS